MNGHVVHVPLVRIRPNPWQVRLQEDPEHIGELAADVRARGLLQVPLGRVVDAEGHGVGTRSLDRDKFGELFATSRWYVQLAFGHSRRSAFELLAREDPRWNAMPVRIQDLGDEAMATAAWAENVQRRDLTPIEEATAIRRRMEDFGWTQAKVAEELGLARPTVANKLRLLDLPEEVRDQVAAGEIPERSAIALKPYYDLPEPVREAVGDGWEMSRVLRDPAGHTSEEIREAFARGVELGTTSLEEVDFGLDQPLEGERVRQPTCEGCPASFSRGGKQRCADRWCRVAKSNAYWDGVLEQASAELGIPVLGDGEQGFAFHTDEEDLAVLQLALEKGCDCLRLEVSTYNRSHLACPEGHTHVYYVCTKQERYCRCRQEVNAEQLAIEKARKKALAAERDRVIDQVAASILAGDAPGLRAVLAYFSRYSYSDNGAKILEMEDPQKLARKLASKIVCDEVANAYCTTAQSCRERARTWLRNRGFPVDGPDPLAGIRRRLERIEGFLGDHVDEPVADEVLQGNLANLEKLAGELVAHPPESEVEAEEAMALMEAIAAGRARIERLLGDAGAVKLLAENVCAQTS